MESNQNIRPGAIFARRVKEARKRRAWSQQTLADRLTELGYPMTRVVLTKLERNDRQVTLEDVFAFAVALGVAPVHLLVPLDDDEQVAVVPTRSFSAVVVRGWLRGLYPAGKETLGVWLSELPASELEVLMKSYLTRGASPIARAFMDEEKLDERAGDLAWEMTEGDAIREAERTKEEHNE
jgi:transcriptional regulator with XRE-family HTH domain